MSEFANNVLIERWYFDASPNLTEEEWKTGYIKATVLLNESEEMFHVVFCRCMPSEKGYPQVTEELICDEKFEHLDAACLYLKQEAVKRRYPDPHVVKYDAKEKLDARSARIPI